MNDLLKKLAAERSLTLEEYEALLRNRTPEIAAKLAEHAVKLRKEVYGNTVYIRGLIEISNICKNDCHYCGIRRGSRGRQGASC